MTRLTKKAVQYLGSEEALILGDYKDGDGNWTAAMGVTNSSGIPVYPKYLTDPLSVEEAVSITVQAIQKVFFPVVTAMFGDSLTDEQSAAALSFEYNTGALHRAFWANEFKEGRIPEAENDLRNNFLNGGELTARRGREADLFFKGTYPENMETGVYPVLKPSFKPDWHGGHHVDILPFLSMLPD